MKNSLVVIICFVGLLLYSCKGTEQLKGTYVGTLYLTTGNETASIHIADNGPPDALQIQITSPSVNGNLYQCMCYGNEPKFSTCGTGSGNITGMTAELQSNGKTLNATIYTSLPANSTVLFIGNK